MGLIGTLLNAIFGSGRNAIVETASIFNENRDMAAERARDMQVQALTQFASEFQPQRKGLFDRLMDGLNRVPRPAMALGCIGLFVAAMFDPIWFSMRMQGIGLVPDPLWWLLGVIVSFYFGARHQAKGQDFQRSIAETMARTPQVIARLSELQELEQSARPESAAPGKHDTDTDRLAVLAEPNAALDAWRRSGGAVPA